MIRSSFSRFSLAALLVSTTFLLQCSSSDDAAPVQRGTAKQGQSCTTANDCAESTALCTQNTKTCTGPINSTSFTTECSATTVNVCSGALCGTLQPNKQNKTGICTMACAVDADCGSQAACIDLSGTKVCLRGCTSNDDCNGFACVQDPTNTSRKGCFVEF